MQCNTPVPDDITGELKKIVARELDLTKEHIARLQPESLLAETLHLDSLAQATFVFAVEDHYGITFELEEMVKIASLQDLVDLIEKRCSTDSQ